MTENVGPKEKRFEAETSEAERSAKESEHPNENSFDGAAEASSRRVFNWDDPRIIRPFYRDGRLIMPVAWRDDDDEDDFYESEIESGALQFRRRATESRRSSPSDNAF